MDGDNFYKKELFEQIFSRLDHMSSEINSIRRDTTEIKSKLVYIYGFAAGVGVFFSFVSMWVRDRLRGG